MTRQQSRKLALILAFASSLLAVGQPALAQGAYPAQRVNMFIGFAAGGFADTIARVIGGRLGERLGQSFQAQNMEGGGGIRAARQATVSPPDGYTILVTTSSLAINESLVASRGYKAEQLQAVAIPVSAPEGMTANNKAGIKSVADLVAKAKAGEVYLGTPGLGSGSHIAAEYFFKQLVKVDVRHIPFAGGNPAALGLITGDINVLAATATNTTIRNINNGDVVGIAIAGRERSGALPNIPTFAESGYGDFQASSWVGFFVPAGTPRAIVDKLNSEINAVMREEETRKIMESQGLDIFIRDGAQTAAFFTEEVANWSKMVKATGLQQ